MFRKIAALAAVTLALAGVTTATGATSAAAATTPVVTASVSGATTITSGTWIWVNATYKVDGKAASNTLRLQASASGSWADTGDTLTVTNGTGGRGLKPTATTTYRLRNAENTAFSSSFTITVKSTTTTTTTPAPAPTTTTVGAPATAGLPSGTALKVHSGNLTVTEPGTVVSGMDIRGFLRIKAANVTVKNSIVRGPSTPLTYPMSLVQASAGATGNIVIQDTTIYSQAPSRFVDGIVGNGFTLNRVNIHTVVDQVKITGDNVLVQNSWLHDNVFYPADANNIETHDDNVQIGIGNNVRVINSTLSGTTNAGVMITQDRGPVTNFVFDKNKADEGACTINVAEKAYGAPKGLKITNNQFGVNQRHARCAVLLSATTQAVATVTGNSFTDGSVFKVSRGS